MAQDDFSTGTVELEEAEVKVDRPPLFTVVIFNDDFTPMEFVVYVIQKFFGYDHAKSTEIMPPKHLIFPTVSENLSIIISTHKAARTL